ncbi:MAG: TIGR04372 family glycosyltransferase [Magnetospirillum sp. WYHS-4]
MTESRRPVVASFLGAQALGNFVMHHVATASVARAIPDCRLVAIYRDDRPYKKFITLLNPYVTLPVALPDIPGSMAPIDWFDGRPDGILGPLGRFWRDEGLHDPDVFLLPNATLLQRCPGVPAGLRIPAALEAPLAGLLEKQGLRKDTWFVCLHLREQGYCYRPTDDDRSVDPLSYLPAIRRIVADHGGQIVRIGDPSMTPLPPLPGFVDLCGLPDSFPLQAYAIARARFFLGTDSGPTQLACALKTPVATTNCLTATVWNDGDLVVHKRASLDGRPLPPPVMREIGFAMGNLRSPRLAFRANPPELLVRAVDRMVEATGDCPEWRPSARLEPMEDSGEIDLPVPWRRFDEIGRLAYLDDV